MVIGREAPRDGLIDYTHPTSFRVKQFQAVLEKASEDLLFSQASFCVPCVSVLKVD